MMAGDKLPHLEFLAVERFLGCHDLREPILVIGKDRINIWVGIAEFGSAETVGINIVILIRAILLAAVKY